jgi:hypothetical protein
VGASNQKPADRGSTLLDQATSAAPAQIKIVQRAVVALLNAIYGEDFLGFSLDALCVGIHGKKSAMADPFPGAPDRRPAHHPPDPEMAELTVECHKQTHVCM